MPCENWQTGLKPIPISWPTGWRSMPWPRGDCRTWAWRPASGLPGQTLVNLRLCRVPRNDAEVLTIARRFELDPARLAAVLRESPCP
jgi:hypothetical protein